MATILQKADKQFGRWTSFKASEINNKSFLVIFSKKDFCSEIEQTVKERKKEVSEGEKAKEKREIKRKIRRKC